VHRGHYDRFFRKRDFAAIFGRWCRIVAVEEEHEGLHGFYHVAMRKRATVGGAGGSRGSTHV
jgi:hypothetical protein